MSEIELVEETPKPVHQAIDTIVESASEQSDERRRFSRRKPVNKGLYGFTRHATDRIVDVVIKRPTARLLLAALLISSIGAVWWAFHYRISSLDYSQELVAERAQLIEHLDDLKHQWSAERVGEVLTQINQAESRLFSDYKDLAAWLRDEYELAVAFGLVMQYQLDPAIPTRVRGVVDVPISLDVITPTTDDTSYLKVMEFVKSLVEQDHYLEVRGATASSNGSGLQSLQLNLHVWVRGNVSTTEIGVDEETTE